MIFKIRPTTRHKMNYDTARDYFLNKPETTESYPFYQDVPVYKVKGKMFGLLSYGTAGKPDADIPRMNLKCDPQWAQELRFFFDGVKPGYHMNKKHWNTVMLDGSVPEYDVKRMIDHSYGLVVKGLKKMERKNLELQYGEEFLYAAPTPHAK